MRSRAFYCGLVRSGGPLCISVTRMLFCCTARTFLIYFDMKYSNLCCYKLEALDHVGHVEAMIAALWPQPHVNFVFLLVLRTGGDIGAFFSIILAKHQMIFVRMISSPSRVIYFVGLCSLQAL